MFFKDRNESRSYFFNVWEKQKNKQPLETIEVLILDVILTPSTAAYDRRSE